jgi:anthranilate/para-aminobenzoate synthase component II
MTSCRQRRRSVDIRKAAFAQTSQAFAFAGRRISICRAAMTPEQEKAALDRLRPLQRWVASPGPSLPAAVGAINAQLRADKQQLKGARRKGLARA